MNVGLDVGTSTCVVACYDGNNFKQVRVRGGGGSPFIPSYVCLDASGEQVHGEGAAARDFWYDVSSAGGREQARRTRRRFKMYIGDYTDDYPRPERTPPEPHTPEGLTTSLTRYLLRETVAQSDVPFDREKSEAVVTVPHGWVHDPEKRTATKQAVTDAGWKVKTVVSEPVAAAAYYVFERVRQGLESPNKQVYLVCDMGGGTFDLSLVRVEKARHLLVIDAECNDWAGDRLDALVAEDLLAFAAGELQENLPTTADDLLEKIHSDVGLRPFMRIAEKLKVDLSATRRDAADEEEIWSDATDYTDGNDASMSLPPMRYRRMEELCRPLLDNGWDMIRKFLDKNTPHRPSRVVLVGGLSPFYPLRKMLRQRLDERFGAEVKFELPKVALDGQLAIARGAALIAQEVVTFQEVLLHPVGIVSLPSHGQIADGLYKATDAISTRMFEKGEAYPRILKSGDRNIRFTVSPGQKLVHFQISFDESDRVSTSKPRNIHDWEIVLDTPASHGLSIELRMEIKDTGDLHIDAVDRSGRHISSTTLEVR